MIEVKEYPEQTVDLYSPSDDYVATLNQAQFLDVRIQILEQKIEGYHIVSPYGKHGLNPDGTIENATEQLFSDVVKLSRKLMALIKRETHPDLIF